jgi:hypothetical protein
VPRNWRIFFAGLLIAKWLVPAFRCFTLPFAVSRNRFLVDLCVFSLDMALLMESKKSLDYERQRLMPTWKVGQLCHFGKMANKKSPTLDSQIRGHEFNGRDGFVQG